MEQPEQEIKLTQPEHERARGWTRPKQRHDDFPGASVFDAKNVSIYYSSFRAVTDVSLTDLRERDHRVHRPVGLRQDDGAADASTG